MWDPRPRLGIRPMSTVLEGGVLTAGLLGQSPVPCVFYLLLFWLPFHWWRNRGTAGIYNFFGIRTNGRARIAPLVLKSVILGLCIVFFSVPVFWDLMSPSAACGPGALCPGMLVIFVCWPCDALIVTQTGATEQSNSSINRDVSVLIFYLLGINE